MNWADFGRGIAGFVVAMLLVGAVPSATADTDKIAYGEYLAGDCVTCHRPEGGKGIPAIAGLPVEATIASLNAYKSGERTNPAMVSAAGALGDEEIEALAHYFASLEPAH